ncbi:Endonuclease IV [Anaerosphaera aminiphila DSM 21120]|uniref:Probable endonuclease 4 n=1 Tax=Anaerosphaera aminiphila DSM 21120 TaxID=1120995 RepID=A0A1M5SPE4_9FIRM|nr:deoxyribonuclease IV [Anaerosphaera aminiphila]SHH40391.1 Endonuclease IV [Anaerosphaera aminiphila DSM 21120]
MKDKFIIGAHQSMDEGFEGLFNYSVEADSNTFQFFMRNPRGSKAKEFDYKDADKLKELLSENNFGKILCHAPYTLNPCSDKEYVREFAFEVMEDDLKRMEYFAGNLYNFHPGSHLKQGIDYAVEEISKLLNNILFEDMNTTVLLETMSGKGTEVGSKFEELKMIIDRVNLKDKLGVCLDTCHVYDAGYNIVDDLDGVLKEFDRIVGLDKLKAIHLNDSKNPMGSHKDRHEEIGKGSIGIDAFKNIINHPKLRNLPFYLETPLDNLGHREEIELLKSLRGE